MTLEEVERDRTLMTGTLDTDVLQVILKEVYLVNEKELLGDILYFVSGEYDTRRGGTRMPSDGWCS